MALKDTVKNFIIKREEGRYEGKLQACKESYDAWKKRKASFEVLDSQNPKAIKETHVIYFESDGSYLNTELQKLLEQENFDEKLCLFVSKSGKQSAFCKSAMWTWWKENPKAALFYGDEEYEGIPWLKPQWSPDTFLDSFYFGSVVGIPAVLLKKSTESNLYSLCFRIMKEEGGFKKDAMNMGKVIHIPKLLFSGNEYLQMKLPKDILDSSIDTLHDSKNEDPVVSIIIPSKDNPETLKVCLDSIGDTLTDSIKIEIIVVDNGSHDSNKEKINLLLTNVKARFYQVQEAFYLYQKEEFNFSKMCNRGAKKAKGKHLLFLNDDIQCTQSGWLEKMLACSEKEYTGAVGIKLLYPHGDLIQHAGITEVNIGPVHKLLRMSDSKTYDFGRNRGIRNVLAVTGACLMVEKSKFLEVNGMEESLIVTFNDVDLCYKLYKKGYYNVVLLEHFLYHHESLSRGDDDSREKMERLMRERDLLYSFHPNLEGKDPFYHPFLNADGLDPRILPEYLLGNQEEEDVIAVPLPQNEFAAYREDACVMTRTETNRNNCIRGYGVVLGSNNAIFEKKLVLKDRSNQERCFAIPFRERYRSDIEENLPDQSHVALAGFSVRIKVGSIPDGEYEIGLMVRDRTSRQKLSGWSGKSIVIKTKENGGQS